MPPQLSVYNTNPSYHVRIIIDHVFMMSSYTSTYFKLFTTILSLGYTYTASRIYNIQCNILVNEVCTFKYSVNSRAIQIFELGLYWLI